MRAKIMRWGAGLTLALWLGACAGPQASGRDERPTPPSSPAALFVAWLQEGTPLEAGLVGPQPVLECYAGAFLGSPDAGVALPVVATACWQPLLSFQISQGALEGEPRLEGPP